MGPVSGPHTAPAPRSDPSQGVQRAVVHLRSQSWLQSTEQIDLSDSQGHTCCHLSVCLELGVPSWCLMPPPHLGPSFLDPGLTGVDWPRGPAQPWLLLETPWKCTPVYDAPQPSGLLWCLEGLLASYGCREDRCSRKVRVLGSLTTRGPWLCSTSSRPMGPGGAWVPAPGLLQRHNFRATPEGWRWGHSWGTGELGSPLRLPRKAPSNPHWLTSTHRIMKWTNASWVLLCVEIEQFLPTKSSQSSEGQLNTMCPRP